MINLYKIIWFYMSWAFIMLSFWNRRWFRHRWGWWLRWLPSFGLRCIRGRCISWKRSFPSCPRSLNPHRMEFFCSRFWGACLVIWRDLWSWLLSSWRYRRDCWWLVGWLEEYQRWRWFWCFWLVGLRGFTSYLCQPLD